ncbi:M56 family metallopeptidase [Kribbella catacumbae]|uniref:M56 family metallopeptidase n=1 Tax=Kribbella catacumbae TaxID=460086 RepID=UPI001ED99D2E|nr:M56 family metallopeptidase [Kribbella catacumbae]
MLWHAAGSSVLVAVVLAGISCVATPGLVEACLEALIGRGDAAGVVTVGVGLLVPTLLVARLAVVAMRLLRAQRVDRGRHLDLLELLGCHDPVLGVTVIAAATPAAYCVPGTDRIVVTDSALRALDPTELRAVLAHERAHLAGRHHLLVTWAITLARAFPGVPVFHALGNATVDLVELLADDLALRRERGDSLATAIATLGGSRAVGLSSGLAAAGGSVLARVQRLLEPPKPLPVATRIGGAGAALTMVALPALVVALPASLALGLAACPFMFG